MCNLIRLQCISVIFTVYLIRIEWYTRTRVLGKSINSKIFSKLLLRICFISPGRPVVSQERELFPEGGLRAREGAGIVFRGGCERELQEKEERWQRIARKGGKTFCGKSVSWTRGECPQEMWTQIQRRNVWWVAFDFFIQLLNIPNI